MNAAIELDAVSRWYGNVVAVNDVTLTIGPGLTGLLGPNGAGKTTVLHMMAGLLAPSAGTIRIGDQNAWRNPDLYRTLGLVTERESVPGFLTATEFLVTSAKLHKLPDPVSAARAALSIVEMEDAADRRIATYSKGMRQRTRVAAALVHEPSVLLLDEPFNGMDPRQRMHMMELLTRMADDGRTILFSSHILEEVEELSGTVQVIVAGRLAASGDYRHIRRLMTNRPHEFTISSSDNRLLATVLIGQPAVSGVRLSDDVVEVHAADYGTFTRTLAKLSREADVRLTSVTPTDESLDKVFSYLVSTEAS